MSYKQFILFFFLFIVLVGCKPNSTEDPIPPDDEEEVIEPIKYKYNYQLHMSNYQDLIEISTTPLLYQDGDQYVEVEVKLKSEDDVADSIVVYFKIITSSKFFPNDPHKETVYEFTFSGSDSYTYSARFSAFLEFEELVITNVSGQLKSNQEYGPTDPYEESVRLKTVLENELETVLHEDLKKINIYQTIQMKSPYYTQTLTTATNIDLESFYYSTTVNQTVGTINTKQDEQYYVYQLLTHDYQPYLQLVGILDDLSTIETDSSPTFDFKDTWFYSFNKDVYGIEAKLGDIIGMAIKDEDVIHEMFSTEDLNLKVKMEVTITNERVTLNITYRMSQTDVTIKTYYNPNRADRINMNSITKVPMNSPLFLTEYTNITRPLSKQLYISEVPNYYLVHLEAGAYAFQNPDDMTLEFFDTYLNPVTPVKDPRFNFQTKVKNVYFFEKGDYLVKVSYRAVKTFEYSLQLLALDETYESIIDIEHPIEIKASPIEVKIEGYYDYVLARFVSEDEGLLLLKSDVPFEGIVSTLDTDGRILTNRVLKVDQGFVIFLYPGENNILFEYKNKIEKVNFTPEAHGVRYQTGDTLPTEFQSEFVVSRPYEDVFLAFEIAEPSMVNFEHLIDPVLGKTGASNYQIWRENKNGILELAQSFSMTDSKEMYFPIGRYSIRVFGLSSIKLKGTITPATPITQATIELPILNQIALYDGNPSTYEKTYVQYPSETLQIDFSVTETTYLFVGTPYNLEYSLMDSSNRTINYTAQKNNQIYKLSPGAYRIILPENEDLWAKDIKLALLSITDPIVLADDNFNDSNQLLDLEFGIDYTFTKSYRSDHEILTFTLEEASRIKLITTMQIYYVILNDQNERVASGYQTKEYDFEAGTYTVLINYMSDTSVGKSFTFSIGYVEV